MIFPDQNVSDAEKNKDNKLWWKSHHDYADAILSESTERIRKIDTLYNDFHGKYAKKKFNEFINRYKDKNRNTSKSKFIDYKMSTSKIDRLKGEYIKRELAPSVVTINRDAKLKKAEAVAMRYALMEAKEEVTRLRNMNIDVAPGMGILDPKDPNFKDKINPKTDLEHYMTLVLKEQIRRLKLKDFGETTIQDTCISAECWGHAYINRNKKVKVERVHPRNAIFEEIEGDRYVEKSGIIGFQIESGLQQVMQNHGYALTKEEIKSLREVETNNTPWNRNGVHYIQRIDGKLVIWETMLYWFSTKKIYEKYVTGTKNEFIEYYQKILSKEYYEENKAQIDIDVAAGRYQIREGYLMTINQSRRIGSNIYINQEEQKYIIRRSDDANEIFYNMTGLLFNSVDGKRLSLFEKLSDLNELYNAIMWQYRREIGRYKGTSIVWDEAWLPEGASSNDVLYNLSEEGIIIINSNAEENQGKTRPETAGVSSVKMGDIQNLITMIKLKMDVQEMMDRVSGINEFREGYGAASATATQNVDAIAASTTITSPIFYSHAKFMENIFMRVIELTKYSIGYLGDTSFDAIIGEDGVEVFKRMKDVHFDDYGVHIGDPNKEAELRQKLTAYSQLAINAKEVRIPDILDAEMASTIQESVRLFKDAYSEMDRILQEQNQSNLQSQEANVKAQIQAQQDDREDRQAHEAEMEFLKAKLDSGKATMDAKNQKILQEESEEQE